jgi:hypothetical protein
MATNLHTWTRVTCLDLQHIGQNIGNAALDGIKYWPESGEGRAVKAASERLFRLLEKTHDRSDLNYVFDNLDSVMAELKLVRANSYFKSHISSRIYKDRSGNRRTFKESLDSQIGGFEAFATVNRPKKVLSKAANEEPEGEFPLTPTASDENSAQQLDEITPEQKAGPLQFEVRNSVLRIKKQPGRLNNEDKKSIIAARSALEENAFSLAKLLSESNCDPRLIDVVKEVHDIIASGADVIRLGIVNFTCDYLFSRLSEEIPDVAAARFQGLNVAIGLYVAQFPEWHRFTENAAKAEIENEDIARTYDIGKAILPALRAARGLVDPEVPKSLELILEALKNPKLAGRRALFGVIRTLENLLAKIISEFANALWAVTEGAHNGAKKATTVIVAGGLLLAVANTAANLSPTAERVIKATWLKQAADILRRGLKDAE